MVDRARCRALWRLGITLWFSMTASDYPRVNAAWRGATANSNCSLNVAVGQPQTLTVFVSGGNRQHLASESRDVRGERYTAEYPKKSTSVSESDGC